MEIVADEPDYLVVSKPPGLGMHDEEDLGVDSAIQSHFDDKALRACHRLDKDTSGLLLIAKNTDTLAKISILFQDRAVEKYYWAVSSRKPKKKQGTIKGGMLKSRNGSWKITRATQNFSLTQFFSYGIKDGLRAFLLRPLTGKTHQLRVAMKSIGAPILGDRRYGGDLADRMYLHAANLRFQWRGQKCSYCCKPRFGEYFHTPGFQEIIARCGSVETLVWPNTAYKASPTL